LCSRTRFRRYQGRRVPFSCFSRPDSFTAVTSASGPVLMFCAPGLVFGVSEGVRSRFHALRARPLFRQNQGRRVPFSSSAFPDVFWAVPRASGPVFIFCAPGLVFGVTEVVGCRFLVLRSRASFRRYGVRRVQFSCFALPGSGVWSRFHVLSSRTHFRRYRGRRVPFSCFTRPDSFSVVPRASGPVFMFCAPVLVFGRSKGVGSLFMLRCPVIFGGTEGGGYRFLFYAPELVFDGTGGVGSRFHVLRSRSHFRRYRGRRF
jgi:hypothetical protein